MGGTPAFHLREQLDELAETQLRPDEVTLLPGYDQWVLGPGTADQRLVPAAHRSAITRGANLLLHAGRVAGIWTIDNERLIAEWFPDHKHRAPTPLEHEAERLHTLLGLTSRATGSVTDLGPTPGGTVTSGSDSGSAD